MAKRYGIWIIAALATVWGCRDKTIVGIESLGSDPASSSNDDTASDAESREDSENDTGCPLPQSFQWTSSGMVIPPLPNTFSIKDPTVVRYDDEWRVFATIYSGTTGWSLVYTAFSEWESAAAAPVTRLTTNSSFSGYMAAPQLFYFSPQERWYLIYQSPNPTYATSTDPSDVTAWTAPQRLMTIPELENSSSGAIDYWVICDDTDCYLFFSADNGVLYRSRTAKSDFPGGFEDADIEVALSDEKFALFEASNVYKMAGEERYLLLVSAIGGVGHYFRSFTTDRLDGQWLPLADTEDNPFTSVNNVVGLDWAIDGPSHGEMLRWNPDETMTIDACDMQYLFFGVVSEGESYGENVCGLGLLTPAP